MDDYQSREERKTAGVFNSNLKERKNINRKQKIRNQSLTCFFDASKIETEPVTESLQLKERIKQLDTQLHLLKNKIPQKKIKAEKTKQRIIGQRKKYSIGVIKVLCQQYQIKRREKQYQNQALGRYVFSKNGSNCEFNPGPMFQELNKQKQVLLKLFKGINEEKKKKDEKKYSHRQRAQTNDFKSSIYKRSLEDVNQRLQSLQTQRQLYRLRMKLAFKELNCYFAKLDWPLLNDKYQILELIGTGGFGQVYRVFDINKLQYFALKLSVPHIDQSYSSQQNFLKHIFREQQIHMKLSHKNIAKLYQNIELKSQQQGFGTIASILELCQGPDLYQYIKQYKTLDEKQAKYVVKQVLQALQYLNKLDNKVIHYDLKPQNILINKGEIKIIDFGLCKVLEQNQDQVQLTSIGTGTAWYLPPQTFDTINPQLQQHSDWAPSSKVKKISPSIDIWAIGVIFFQMLYGKKAFCHNLSQDQIWETGVMKKLPQIEFPTSRKVSQQAKNFIKECLKNDPCDRLKISKALSHPYFSMCCN